MEKTNTVLILIIVAVLAFFVGWWWFDAQEDADEETEGAQLEVNLGGEAGE